MFVKAKTKEYCFLPCRCHVLEGLGTSGLTFHGLGIPQYYIIFYFRPFLDINRARFSWIQSFYNHFTCCRLKMVINRFGLALLSKFSVILQSLYLLQL